MTKIAYLTIDDGPSNDFMNKLGLLAKHDIPAVWFCQGNHMETRPQAVIEALRLGHLIGNHSYSHPSFDKITLDQGYAEIRATDTIIDELHARAGIARRHRVFRFPYGDKGGGPYDESTGQPAHPERHAAFQAYLRKLGYVHPPLPDVKYAWYQPFFADIDLWGSYDTLDWSPFIGEGMYGIDTPEKVLARMDEDDPDGWRGLNDDSSSDIIIMHDHEGGQADLFPRMIARLLEKGIQLNSVV